MIQRSKQQKQSQTPNSFQIYKQFLKNIQVTFQLCCHCNAENRSFLRFGKLSNMFRMTRTCLFGFSEWQRITENLCSGYSGYKNSTGHSSAAQRPAVIVSLPGLGTQVCPCHMGDTGQATISLTSLPVQRSTLSLSVLYQCFQTISHDPLGFENNVLSHNKYLKRKHIKKKISECVAGSKRTSYFMEFLSQ